MNSNLKSATIVILSFLILLCIGFIIIDDDNIEAATIETFKSGDKVPINDNIFYEVLDIDPDYNASIEPNEGYNFVRIRVKFTNLTMSTIHINSFVCKNDLNENCNEYFLDNITSKLAPESNMVTSFYFEVNNDSGGLELYYNDDTVVNIDLPNF